MISTDTVDLTAYFRRIDYQGDRTPTLATLQALHLRHPLSIPFENLSPLLNEPVKLDRASLEDKLVNGGRGGYCFEHNLLFSHVLKQLGFQVTQLAARVLWSAPETAITPRSHMLLLVDLEGERYIADVGFGGVTLTAPLKLIAGVEQRTPHEIYRLVDFDGDLLLQVQLGDAWKSLYRFDLQPQHLVDYEVSSWHLSHHPESPFVRGLMAARALPDRRYGLLNDSLATHHLHGPTERRRLENAEELRGVLETLIGVTLPGDGAVQALLERLVTASQPA